MAVNIEIKARATDFLRQRELAGGISDSPVELLEQTDTFFVVGNGRLKLREFADADAELIHYWRPDQAGPKKSEYTIVPVPDPALLKSVLSAALGTRGVVRKRRHLYLVGHTKIHFDEVVDLGEFIELEVVCSTQEQQRQGPIVARGLMKQLEIVEADLIDRPYIDLLGN